MSIGLRDGGLAVLQYGCDGLRLVQAPRKRIAYRLGRAAMSRGCENPSSRLLRDSQQCAMPLQ